MRNGYSHDVFLSYPRSEAVGEWMSLYFYPLLKKWLPTETSRDPKIFIDVEMEKGSEWPAYLKRALLGSRCMITVWSAEYFRSKWCLAEWQSMLQRQQSISIADQSDSCRLIFPIK